jgi:hypothetical protein
MSLKAIAADMALIQGLLKLGAALPYADELEETLRNLGWPGWQDHENCWPHGDHKRSHRVPLDLGGGRILHTSIQDDQVTDLYLIFAVFWPPFGREHHEPAPADGIEDPHDDYFGPAFVRHPRARRAEFNMSFERFSQLIGMEIGPPLIERYSLYDWRRLAWRHHSCLISLIQCDDNLTLGQYDSAQISFVPWSPGDPVEPIEP